MADNAAREARGRCDEHRWRLGLGGTRLRCPCGAAARCALSWLPPSVRSSCSRRAATPTLSPRVRCAPNGPSAKTASSYTSTGAVRLTRLATTRPMYAVPMARALHVHPAVRQGPPTPTQAGERRSRSSQQQRHGYIDVSTAALPASEAPCDLSRSRCEGCATLAEILWLTERAASSFASSQPEAVTKP